MEIIVQIISRQSFTLILTEIWKQLFIGWISFYNQLLIDYFKCRTLNILPKIIHQKQLSIEMDLWTKIFNFVLVVWRIILMVEQRIFYQECSVKDN